MSNPNASRGYLSAEDLAIPTQIKKKTVSLSGATAGHQQFPINFKSITIVTTEALFARFDFAEDVEASPGDVSDSSKDNIIPIPSGTSIWPFKNYVNTVSLVIAAGTGTVDVHLIPGEGRKSGLSGAGIDWDTLNYA